MDVLTVENSFLVLGGVRGGVVYPPADDEVLLEVGGVQGGVQGGVLPGLLEVNPKAGSLLGDTDRCGLPPRDPS